MVKEHMIRVRAHRAHVVAWKTQANREGRTLSEWLRWLADLRVEESMTDDQSRHGTAGSA